MKQTSIILIVLLQALFSFGQIVDFKEMSFDLSKLDYKNEYREEKIDTVYIPSIDDHEIQAYGKSVFASKNHEYFVVAKDTTYIAAMKTIGYDAPPYTYFSYYHKDTLLWSKFLNAGMGDVFFFENDEYLMIKLGFFELNGLFSFNKNGQPIDTISPASKVFRLDNDLLLIKDYVSENYDLGGTDQISIIDSRGFLKWENNLNLRVGEQRDLEVAQNGSKFSIRLKDSIWLYDSDYNLLWKQGFQKYKYSPHFIGNGDFMFAKKYENIDDKTQRTKPELYIYDSKTGNFINKIDTVFYGDKCLISLFPRSIINSELIYYENISLDNNKFDIIITDIKGKVVLFKSLALNKRPTSIAYYKGFNLYYNDNLIETIKY
jgi:hypothetical protein